MTSLHSYTRLVSRLLVIVPRSGTCEALRVERGDRQESTRNGTSGWKGLNQEQVVRSGPSALSPLAASTRLFLERCCGGGAPRGTTSRWSSHVRSRVKERRRGSANGVCFDQICQWRHFKTTSGLRVKHLSFFKGNGFVHARATPPHKIGKHMRPWHHLGSLLVYLEYGPRQGDMRLTDRRIQFRSDDDNVSVHHGGFDEGTNGATANVKTEPNLFRSGVRKVPVSKYVCSGRRVQSKAIFYEEVS